MPHLYQSIEGGFDFEDIYDLAVRRCGSKAARLVEVGAYQGRSTCFLAERIREAGLPITLDVVDHFAGDASVGAGDLWPVFSANLDRAGLLSALTVHRRASPEAAESFADATLDFVFIDADHSFDAVTKDISAWWPKLRPGGLLAGHDYLFAPGVRAAVDRFVADHQLGAAFRTSRASWLVFKSLAIDAAYCINLARRPDRRRQAEAQFAAASLDVQFIDAVDGKTLGHPKAISDGQAGCSASHLAVIRAAREAGHAHVLIFEDDIQLAQGFQAKLCTALSRCPATFDLCHVGAVCLAGWNNYLYPFDDHLARVGAINGTHAYIVNLAIASRIEAGLADLRNVVDNWYSREIHPAGNSYACTPYLAFQTAGLSDVAEQYHASAPPAEYVFR